MLEQERDKQNYFNDLSVFSNTFLLIDWLNNCFLIVLKALRASSAQSLSLFQTVFFPSLCSSQQPICHFNTLHFNTLLLTCQPVFNIYTGGFTNSSHNQHTQMHTSLNTDKYIPTLDFHTLLRLPTSFLASIFSPSQVCMYMYSIQSFCRTVLGLTMTSNVGCWTSSTWIYTLTLGNESLRQLCQSAVGTIQLYDIGTWATRTSCHFINHDLTDSAFMMYAGILGNTLND